MKRLDLDAKFITLTDQVLDIYQETVTKYGTGAKVNCPKKYLGKTVYVVICKGEE